MERVVVLDSLSYEELARLFDGRRAALIVRPFAKPDLCRQIAEKLLGLGEEEPYLHEVKVGDAIQYKHLGVNRVGYPFNLTLSKDASSESKQHYYEEALHGTRRIRELADPTLSPIDKLRLFLDELWPNGANVAAFEGRKMLVGIGRLMRAELSAASEETPHVDILPPHVHALDNQLAANVFLRMPDRGGELLLWDIPPFRQDAPPGSNLLSYDHLGDPLIIAPQLGDLTLFCSMKPHATTSFPAGLRITLQCFIGEKHGEPLYLWN